MEDSIKDILRLVGMSNQIDKVEHGFCPTCDKPVSKSDFRDKLSLERFQISGMCQKCQSEVFDF